MITNLCYSDFTPTVSGKPPTTPPKKSNIGLIVGITVGVGAVSFVLIFVIVYMKMKQRDVDDEEGKG